MKLNIGDSIRRLRKERDITQEEFAEHLGVSTQSVSRWENHFCYPDIEMIPVIADFFHVSVDHLLGRDDTKEKARVTDYLAEFEQAISVGDIEECIRIARAGVAEFPNNYALLDKLMYVLFVSTDNCGDIPNWQENLARYDDEIVALGERIIKYCPDEDIRFSAITRLAFHHCEAGRRSLGRALYKKLPRIDQCREAYQWWSLDEDEKLPFVQGYILESHHQLQMALGLLGQKQLIPDEQALDVLDRRVALDKLLGLDTQHMYYAVEAHIEPARLCARLGQQERMYRELRATADAAKAFDARPDSRTIDTLLFGEITRRHTDFDTTDPRPVCRIMHDDWLQETDFAPYRGEPAFEEILDMVKE